MSNYENLSREELLKLVEKQENELKNKKYGLVWDSEKEPEQVVLDCENNIPILQRVKEKEIKTDENDDNILIEGDNYHALTCLNYTHKGKIDVIYIDPPYNTGNKDFVYNDRYVDKEDTYRHSKWLNFMEKRLKLAINLLSKNGTIFISIDDNELGQLKLLCDNIFGENSFVAIIPRITSYQRSGQENYMNVSHDYVLCYSYALDFDNNIERKIQENKKIKKDHIGSYIEGDTKAILAALSQGYSKGGDYDFEYNGKIYKPETSDGVRNRWLWTKERMKIAAKLGILVETKNSLRMQIYLDKKFEEGTNKMIEKNEKLIFHTADFMNNNVYTNVSGTQILNSVIGNDKFNNPKPIELIKKTISFSKDKNGIILDFFAGSGTTGQAVLELNKEDSGNRRFILCTNNDLNGIGSDLAEKNPNENREKFGICQRVTYSRLEKVIKGYNKNGNGEFVEGLNGNLQYFKTDLIAIDENDKTKNIKQINDQKRLELTEKAGWMIAIKENTFEEIEANEWYQIFENKDKSRKTVIYFREDEKKIQELINKIGKTKTNLYIFSYGKINKQDFSYVGKNIFIEDIPEPILEIYKEINLTLKG